MTEGMWLSVVNICTDGQCQCCILLQRDCSMLLLEEKLGGWVFSSWSPSALTCVHKSIVSQVVCGLSGVRQTTLISACCEDEGDFVTWWHVSYCFGMRHHESDIVRTFVTYGY
jgi:hypothetical protein